METVAQMKLPGVPTVQFPKKQAVRYDRVSKGKVALPGVDGRTRFAKRYDSILDDLCVEYRVTEPSRLLMAREAAHIAAWLDLCAARAAGGDPTDEILINRRQNSLRRLLEDLGGFTRAARVRAHYRAKKLKEKKP